MQPAGHYALPWTKLLSDDLVEMQRVLAPKLDELGDPLQNSQAWVAFMKEYPQAWKLLVRRYYDSNGVLAESTTTPVFVDLTVPPRSGVEHMFVCHCCATDAARVFLTAQALAAHLANKHGHRRSAHLYIGSDMMCPACGRSFATKAKAVHHLQWSATACRRRMLAGELPVA